MRKAENGRFVLSRFRILLPGSVLLVCLLTVWCGTSYSIPVSQWLNLPTDSKDAVRSIIQSEVNKHGFSTPQQDADNARMVENEKTKAETEYNKTAYEADAEFKSARSRRDTLTSQFQRKAAEVEEAEKNIKLIRNTIENFNSSILRYESDIKAQQESMKKRMKEMKQGEVVVATIYNVGFNNTTRHNQEKLADMVSSPLMSQYMGVYIKSFTEVVNNAVIIDYIKSISSGTQRWISENPLTFMLVSNHLGTTYLRIKRYELYPFQEWLDKTAGVAASEAINASIITSSGDLRRFAATAGYTLADGDIAKVEAAIQETQRRNHQADADVRDQTNGFLESVRSLERKIADTKADRESQKGILDRKLKDFEKLNAEFQTARTAKENAEQLLEAKHLKVRQVNSVKETIIIQPAFAAIRGEQTAADACAETIIDKLNQVRNNARVQHSSSSTTVINSQYVDGTDLQEFKEAKITSVKLISFLNKGGEQVEVKVAFRVRTVMGDGAGKVKAEVVPKKVTDEITPEKGRFITTQTNGDGEARHPLELFLTNQTSGAAGDGRADALYLKGLESFKANDMAAARTGLTQFVEKNPAHELVPNARYWIGETFYSEKNYKQAILEFQEVIKLYPKKEKAPAAMLKQALSFKALKDIKSARYVLNKLSQNYSRTDEARKARALLKEL